jgi:hypothetical protein
MVSYETHFLSFPRKIVSQFVIPAKSRDLSGEASAKTEAGCEPGSRMIGFPAIFLDSGSRPTPYRGRGRLAGSPGMTVFSKCDTAFFAGMTLALTSITNIIFQPTEVKD